MSALLPLLACLFVPLIIAVEVTPRDFVGKWRLMNSDNFDEYMKAVGIGWMTRKLASAASQELTIAVHGNHWTLSSVSTFKNHNTQFELGKQFDETTPDGRTLKSEPLQTTFTFENGKLIAHQKPIASGDVESRITHTVSGNRFTIEMKANDVIGKQFYEKVVE